jgi:hypothetical protein
MLRFLLKSNLSSVCFRRLLVQVHRKLERKVAEIRQKLPIVFFVVIGYHLPLLFFARAKRKKNIFHGKKQKLKFH